MNKTKLHLEESRNWALAQMPRDINPLVQPTLSDFEIRLAWHLDEAIQAAAKNMQGVRSRASAAGVYYSSATILMLFEEASMALEKGVDAALGELTRARRTTDLNAADMRNIVEKSIEAFVVKLKSVIKPPDMRSPSLITPRMEDLNKQVAFRLRQYDVGLHDPGEPETPMTTNNSITIGNLSGGAVQQGNGSVQINNFAAIPEDILQKLERFQESLEKMALAAEHRASLSADAETLRAQLRKPVPSPPILSEIGRSMRNVLEEATGGALAGPLAGVASALWAALGLV